MERKKLFKKTVSILKNAYKKDLINPGSCLSCAVGNIVSVNCGIKNIKNEAEWVAKTGGSPSLSEGWPRVFFTPASGFQVVSPNTYLSSSIARKQIDMTGYTWQDLAKIENAFEKVSATSYCQYVFLGLLSVYDTLCKIHKANRKKVKDPYLVFTK